MKDVIIAALVVIVLIFGFVIFQKDKQATYEPWPETEPASTTTPKPQTDPIACTPSISVSSPVQGAAYTTGQQVTIKWTSCGVQNVYLGLVSGGKDYGLLSETPIPASTGSYQWTATNPGKSFTDLSTNSYQIGITSGSVVAKSGTFTVTTPSTSSNLENIETPIYIKSIYQKSGKWWADVDYVTYMDWKELLTFQVSRGECAKTQSDVEQGLATGGPSSPEFENYVVCGSIRYTDTNGRYVNQNPLIRSFQFAAGFESTGVGAGCFDGGVPNTPEAYKNFLDSDQYSSVNYSYGVYQTRGLLIENAIIKNSQITEFNFPTSCVG